MSNLVEHAIVELELLGYDLNPNHKTSDDFSSSIALDVLGLLKTFANQGHSGTSAAMVREMFYRLANFEALAPLTGEDDEWNDVSQMNACNGPLWQNKRCSHVFKNDERAWDIETDEVCPDGQYRFAPISFPYSPRE